MPYASQRDRTPGALEITKSPWPASPLNLTLRSGFRPGVYELSWDDPAGVGVNRDFVLTGVNIYRSFDSEFGPFERITEIPVGATFWRDVTNNVLVEEDVSGRFTAFGATTAGMDAQRFVFKTLYPIVKEGSQQKYSNSPLDVQVYVDGVLARVKGVTGLSGEVELDIARTPEVGTQSLTPAVVPTSTSKVTCVYRYTKSLLRTDLMQRVFYRVTAVGLHVDADSSVVQSLELVETPLVDAVSTSSYEVEKVDFMWKEAVRRNRWILEQGGERVQLFLRKHVGLTCPCVPDHFHKQGQGDCLICYGTAIVGGYEGPYETIVAPDDGERRISQKEQGLVVEHSYEVWTGPMPILTQRDFLVKLNGERYSVGAVRFPSNRGMVLQQHFTIAHIAESDIRRQVPLDGAVRYPAVQFAPQGPENGGSSETTDKPNIPEDRQLRGRTKAWENGSY